MRLTILVKPGSRQGSKILENPDGTYAVYLREKPHDGEANAALLELLSEHFKVPKTSIKILSGLSSRHKLVEL